jgi:hypothetical protein
MALVNRPPTRRAVEWTLVVLAAHGFVQRGWEKAPFVKRMCEFVQGFNPDKRVNLPDTPGDALLLWYDNLGFAPWPSTRHEPNIVLKMANEFYELSVAAELRVTARETHERCNAEEGLRLFHQLWLALRDVNKVVQEGDVLVALYFVALVLWHDVMRTLPPEDGTTKESYIPPDVLVLPSAAGVYWRLGEMCPELERRLAEGKASRFNLLASERLFEWCVKRENAHAFEEIPSWLVALRDAIPERLAPTSASDAKVKAPVDHLPEFDAWLQGLWPVPPFLRNPPLFDRLLRSVSECEGSILSEFVHVVSLAFGENGVARRAPAQVIAPERTFSVHTGIGKTKKHVFASGAAHQVVCAASSPFPRAVEPSITDEVASLKAQVLALQSMALSTPALRTPAQSPIKVTEPDDDDDEANGKTPKKRSRHPTVRRTTTTVVNRMCCVETFTPSGDNGFQGLGTWNGSFAGASVNATTVVVQEMTPAPPAAADVVSTTMGPSQPPLAIESMSDTT